MGSPKHPSSTSCPTEDVGIDQLQTTMVGAWPAMESEPLGQWLLRASRGFTHRGNSVVTAGSPGVPLPEALDQVEQWYAARGLPANLTVAGPPGFDVSNHRIGRLAVDCGYLPRIATHTYIAPTQAVALLADRPLPRVTISAATTLTEAWMAIYRGYRTVDEVAARAILTGSSHQVFATASDPDGAVIAIGRLGVSNQWGGIAAMSVSTPHRGSGIGQALLVRLAREAAQVGVDRLHLQVDSDNTPAIRLYERAGFALHHDYINLPRP